MSDATASDHTYLRINVYLLTTDPACVSCLIHKFFCEIFFMRAYCEAVSILRMIIDEAIHMEIEKDAKVRKECRKKTRRK